MSFFIRQSNGTPKTGKIKRGKQQNEGNQTEQPKQKKKKKKGLDDEIESDSDEENLDGDNVPYLSSEEDEETAQEKKLRLTKQYLSQMEAQEAEKEEDEELRKDAISHRLNDELKEQSGQLFKQVADDYLPPDETAIKVLRGHQLPVTCLVITPDHKHVFSASKDCSIIKWSVADLKKVHVIHGGRKGTEKRHTGHTAHVLCLAISSDAQYLASGDANKLILIWKPENCQLIHTFTGHRAAVSGLAFRKGTHQMFSGGLDRFIKVWNLDEMAYVETLFGHQDAITAVDSLSRDRALTCGGRDNTIRIWKIVEESQLIFNGHGHCIDCVSLINESSFVSGADDNSISLWGVMKKKPLYTLRNAHRSDAAATGTTEENWITAVCSLQHTDLIASGSRDGCIRLWRCNTNFKMLTPLFTVPVKGFVNSLKFASNGTFLVAGVGQEPRLGRWWRIKEARNSVCIIPLCKKDPTEQ